MNIIGKIMAVMMLAGLLAACGGTGGTKAPTDIEVEDRSAQEGLPGAPAEEGATARALPDQEGVQAYPMTDDPASPLSKRVIYFDYDKSEVRDEFRPIVQAHANFLGANPRAQITLEGHTDERGSREYNIALGERRAEAVRRLMLFMGASDGQIQTVSYGEERPAAQGHDDAAWQQNRRVEIIYKR